MGSKLWPGVKLSTLKGEIGSTERNAKKIKETSEEQNETNVLLKYEYFRK